MTNEQITFLKRSLKKVHHDLKSSLEMIEHAQQMLEENDSIGDIYVNCRSTSRLATQVMTECSEAVGRMHDIVFPPKP